MAVTRINNNQITDASAGNVYLGIDASTKLQNYSVTAGKIANNLVYGSDLTVSGNLTVNGTSTAIDTTITTIEDPVIVLASTQTGSPSVDIGFLGERGTANNIAFVWNEANSEFVTAFTSTSETNTTISILGYADIHTLNATVGGNIAITGTTSLVGNIISDANVTGTITGANLLTAGLVSATGTITSGSNITGANLLTGGIVSATGTATAGNIATGGTVSAGGNVTGANVLTGGLISATGTITSGSNISAANVTTGGQVSAGGNITGAYFIGNGSQLTGVTASSANAETLTGTFLAPNVLASSLTSVGALANLSVVGTTQSGNLQTAGLVSAGGNVTGGNINTAGVSSATGNVTGGNVLTGGLVSASGAVIAGSLETLGTANVTNTITGGNISTGGFLSAVGTATVGNLATAGTASATGTVTGGNLATGGTVSATGTVTGGNIATGGTASATGTVTGGNIATGGTVSATGNISGSYFLGNGRQLTGVVAESANAETLTGAFLAPNVLASSLTSVGDLTSLSVVGTTQSGNLQTAGIMSAGGNITGANVLTGGLVSATGTATVGNLATGGTVSATGNVTGANILTGGFVSATGTATVGNLATGGTVSATGTVTGGNLATGGTASATGTVTGGNLATGGTVSATGTATAGNVATAGTVSAGGNVTGANVLTGGLVSAGGNVTGANILTGGIISATGNIYGGNLDAAQVYSATTLTLRAGTGNILLDTVGNIVLANTVINGVAQPLQDQDAATKLYVDTIATTGITFHEEVFATTNTTLATATGGTISYAQPNGVSNGIGAYIQTTGTFTTIDTANVQTVGTRILVKNEANAVLNGVYTYSNATAIVRATDADEYGSSSAESFSINDYFFTTSGNVNAGAAFVVDAPSGTITFGTSNIQFAQFSSSQTYSANIAAGISLIGQTFNAKVDNDTTAFDGGGNISVKAGANLTTPNIGAATGTSLSTTGTITGGNLATGGTVSATGTATAGNIATGGTVSATGTATLGNVATAGTVSAGGNVTGANILTGGLISATGTATAGNLATGGTVSATGNITGANVATGGIVTAAGTVTGGNLITSGTVSATGTATVGNVATGGTVSATGTITGGNVATGGTVSATGTATAGNLATGGTVSATGNITGNYFIGNGSQLTGVIANSANAETLTGTFLAPNVLASSLTSVGDLTSLSVVGTTQSGNLATGGTVSATGTITGGNVATGGTVSATGTATAGNLATGGTVSATGTITGGNVATGGTVSATGEITGANLVTGGTVSATGNVTGGNVLTGGLVSSTGTVTGGNLITGGILSSTGTATVGNIITSGTASVTGTATVGNISTVGTVSATGAVTGGNINTAGNVSATGNVMGAYLIGNIIGSISSPGANTDVIFNDNGQANATSGFTFNKTTNAVDVTGTITGGNIATGGTVSATGTATAGNLATGGTVSATATITGGNLATGGTVSATATITGGNLATGGTASASGNITGGNISTAGALQGGNIVISGDDITDTNGRVNFNTAGADVDFAVNGDTVANVFYVDAGVGTASFGSATQTTNSVVAFNATNSILMPVGNTAQRPTGVTGQFRFNTTVNSLEIYDNAAWVTVGQPDFTLITDQQFNGDGSTVVFTLSGNATTAGSIVSINGVQQIPTTAYAVSGTTLTFTEAPATGDLIDVRVLTTTTSVYSISNSTASAVVAVQDGSNVVAVTGDLSVSGTILGGNINSTAITNGTSSVAVIASGGNIRANVGGTTVQTISAGLVAITGDLSVTGNATLSGNILGDRIQNGTTSFDIQTPSGNANITVGGTSNVAVFSPTIVTLAANLIPTANVTYDLGTTTNRWKDIWLSNSTIYMGNAQISANATSLIFTNPQGGQTVLAGATASITGATVSASGNITGGNLSVGTGTITGGNIVNSNANGVGNIGSATTYFNTVFAKATSAQYADLAEKYVADAEYAPGTVVVFGGTHEVTVNATDADRKVAGVISTNPSYIMNGGLVADHVATVALTGRVPTLVVGTVRKGDLMVAAGLGRARAEADPKVGTVIGKALEDFDGAEGTIEVVVGRF